MIPKIEEYPDYPSVPTDVLDRSDEQARLNILDDDTLYSRAAAELLSRQDKGTGNDTPDVEDLNLEADTKADPVIEPVVETPVEVTEETSASEVSEVETENPFRSVGMPDEIYQRLVEKGVIREGKLHGLYSPDKIDNFWNYYDNDVKLRGKLANEIHTERVEKEELANQVKQTKEELLKTKQEILKEKQKSITLEEKLNSISLKAEKTEPLLFSQDLIPTGLTQEQADLVRQLALDKTRADLARKFQSRGVPFPETSEDWEELRVEHNDLFSLADSKRDDNYNTQVKWALTSLGVDRSYENLIKDSFLQSGYDFVESLQSEGYPVDDETPEVKAAVEKAMSALNKEREIALAEGRSPDPRYFKTHPITGHAFLRSDAISSYIALNDKSTWGKLHSGQFTTEETTITEPAAVPTDTQDRVTITLADALESFATYLQESFQLDFPQSSPELQQAVSALAEKRDDPRYWSNGDLRKESLISYFSTENPSFIAKLLNDKVEAQYNTRLAEATNKAQEALLNRKANADDTIITAASSIDGKQPTDSLPGSTIPIPELEDFQNPFFMKRLAEQHNMDVDELFDVLEPQIKKIPDPDLREQYLRT